MPYKHVWLGMAIAVPLALLYHVVLRFLGPNPVLLALPIVLGGAAFFVPLFTYEQWIMRRVSTHGSMYTTPYNQVRTSLRRSNLYRNADANRRQQHLYPHLFSYAAKIEAARWTGLGFMVVAILWISHR